MNIRAKHLTILFAVLAVAGGGHYVASMDERGFEDYLKRIAGEKGAVLKSVVCSMNNKHGRSRNGWCQFPADPALFEQVKAAFELQENRETTYDYVSAPEYVEGCYAQEWIRNPAHEDFSGDMGKTSPLRQGVADYRTLKNFPMPGNTSTSFIRAFYSKTENKVCVDLRYPYG